MKDTNTDSGPLIIMGMHRSGTSVLARYLSDCGYFLGKDLDSNEESIFFRKTNIWILQQVNATWDNPDNYKFINPKLRTIVDATIQKRLGSYRRTAYLGLSGSIANNSIDQISRPWGWKDPLNCITFDTWKRNFPNAKGIFIVRNPIDSAISLQKRELARLKVFEDQNIIRYRNFIMTERFGYSRPVSFRALQLEEGVELWKAYNDSARKHYETFEGDIHLLKYEDLLENPAKELGRIDTFLQMSPSSSVLSNYTSSLKPDRKFAFLEDPKGRNLYDKFRNDPLITGFGFDKIL